MDLTGIGLRRLLGALREQNTPLVFLGAALVAFGLARRLGRIDDQPVYSQKLEPGDSVRVDLSRPDSG